MTIKLFYPATFLPHKNHAFLRNREIVEYLEKSNIKIILTIEDKDFKLKSNCFEFIGRVPYKICLSILRDSSALFFLSDYESLGLPILEAIFNKKSIIVPNLSYSEELIGKTGYLLKYPLNVENIIEVLDIFKSDFINGKNRQAKLKSNIVSSMQLIKIFKKELKL